MGARQFQSPWGLPSETPPRERGCTHREGMRGDARVEIDITRIAFAMGMPPFLFLLFSLVHLRIPSSPCGKAYTFFPYNSWLSVPW